MTDKRAATDYQIHELLVERWSPYSFDSRPVSKDDICSLFEAARWSASSFNEQPWSYIVATRENPLEFGRLLSCLVEKNQLWAKAAPVLALGVVSLRFKRNNKENRSAVHDLGLASANLVFEATARGLYVHQMIGILPDRARELYRFSEDVEAWTALAIGYKGDSTELPDELQERDLRLRTRKSLSQFVFSGTWGEPSPVLLKKDG